MVSLGPWVNILAILLAIPLALAAGAKLSASSEFKVATGQALPRFSSRYGQVFLVAVPLLELMIAFWLASGWYRREAFAVAFVLLAAFTLALLEMYRHGHQSECYCFGRIFRRWRGVSVPPLARNGALLVIAAGGLFGLLVDSGQHQAVITPWLIAVPLVFAASAWFVGMHQVPQREPG